MKPRERILAVAVATLLVLYLGNWMFQQLLQQPLEARRARAEQLRREVAEKEVVLRRARRSGSRLAAWNAQSLPADAELARSLYQQWLLELVENAGFEQPNVDSAPAVARRGTAKNLVYQRLPFTVRGRASLEQITGFLFEFYRANHLQQIQRLSMTPSAESDQLDLSISIEALVLPTAGRSDRLSQGTSDKLTFAEPTAYASVVTRNIFGQGTGSFDQADYTYVTAILEVGGSPEVWFTIRTTGEVLKLAQGGSFEVGQFHGTVAEIDSPDVVVESDDERWLLTLGENLMQATALPPDF